MSIFDAGSTTNTQTSQVSVPTWINNAWQNLYGQANALAQNPYQLYQGPQVADLTANQNQAIQLAGQNVGNYQPFLSNAAGLFGNAATTIAGAPAFYNQALGNYNAASAMTGNVQPFLNAGATALGTALTAPTAAGINQYLNPYNQDVVNATMTQLNQQFGEQNAANKGAAALAGAFGGSRFGVQQALTNQLQGQTTAQTLANLNAQNYSQALNQFNTQQGVNLQGAYQAANLGNLSLSPASLLTGIGSGLSNLGTASLNPATLSTTLGTNYGNLAQMQQQLGQQDIASLMGTGAVQQGQTQTAYNTAYQNFLNQIQWPYQQLGFASGILQGAPSPQSSVTNTTVPTSSTASQLLGLGIGTVGALGQSGAFGQQGWLSGLL